jgi:hypothetical protein
MSRFVILSDLELKEGPIKSVVSVYYSTRNLLENHLHELLRRACTGGGIYP